MRISYYTVSVSVPNTPAPYYDYGVRKVASKQFLLAIKNFDKAIQQNNKSFNAYYNLGISYLKSNQPEKACVAWKTATN